MAWVVDSSSVRRTEILDAEALLQIAAWRSVFRVTRLESRWIMGHNVMAMPRRVSTLDRGEAMGAPRGGKGMRLPAVGAAERGARPLERAAITS